MGEYLDFSEAPRAQMLVQEGFFTMIAENGWTRLLRDDGLGGLYAFWEEEDTTEAPPEETGFNRAGVFGWYETFHGSAEPDLSQVYPDHPEVERVVSTPDGGVILKGWFSRWVTPWKNEHEFGEWCGPFTTDALALEHVRQMVADA